MALYNPPATFTFVDTSSTGSEVANSLSNVGSIIVPANTNRQSLTIFNSLTQTVYIDVTSSVSVTNYMVPIPAGGFYELPIKYTGAFYGIIASGTGSVEIREFV
ncbi:hypothetical protein [Nostoc sp. WHI]|uniref:hypothetical protein n=1 Tax=Nostoc sp. WHI TaxID=2650611 RepID=UPI0018C73726|nr:hypothetical protein [Nostoc sp. WHI]MBG1268253.1 hypothetical protein [Nostoc sp. WHI]